MLRQKIDQAVAAGLDGVDVNADPAVVTRQLVEYSRRRLKDFVVWVSPTAIETCATFTHMAQLGSCRKKKQKKHTCS